MSQDVQGGQLEDPEKAGKTAGGTCRTADVPGCAGRTADVSEVPCRTSGRPNMWEGQLNVHGEYKGTVGKYQFTNCPSRR